MDGPWIMMPVKFVALLRRLRQRKSFKNYGWMVHGLWAINPGSINHQHLGIGQILDFQISAKSQFNTFQLKCTLSTKIPTNF
ncbi:hypothetical protein WICMUC_002915 [Wickerhamomyces mucosus]|uniref:Uncharacterized protein n=1 Tax=Wickerhamomyces mucosus TaxID=1378264 RepID=A0A9P8PMX9_9ASCO|nr:hypothetical protein WICMUC_002915 [Wickerhamomyces mucosus]